MINLKCRQCSEYFKASRSDAKTCSPMCRVKYARSYPGRPQVKREIDLPAFNKQRKDGLVTLNQKMVSGVFAGTHTIYGELILPEFPLDV